jgi:hypothetical protein
MNRNIRFPITAFLLCLASFFTQAQTGSDNFQRSVYLFPQFINGSVLLKSGIMELAALNYNVEKQGIVFEKSGQYLDLIGLETIDTVYIEGRKFIPVDGIFYEVIRTTPFEMYATYTGKKQPVTATTEHDGSLRKEANEVSNTVSDVYVTRQYRGDYAIEFRKQYWIKQFRNFYKANTEKQVLKIFPKKEAAIRTFIAENKTDFNKEADVLKLLAFCYQ